MSNGDKQKVSTSSSPSSSSSSLHLFAGLTSGFTSSILLQPADLLKTRVQQVQKEQANLLAQSQSQSPQRTAPPTPGGGTNHTLPNSTEAQTQAHTQRIQNPVLHTFRTILSEPRPLQQLWRGTLPSIVRTSIGSAMYFAALERLRGGMAGVKTVPTAASSTIHASTASAGKVASAEAEDGESASTAQHTKSTQKQSPMTNLVSGAIARASVGFITMPITVLKLRVESAQQSSLPPPAATTASSSAAAVPAGAARRTTGGVYNAAMDIARTSGVRGFFAGAGATALRDAPYAGLYLVFYEQARRFGSLALDLQGDKLRKSQPDAAGRDKSTNGSGAQTAALVNFVSGATAAAAATTLTNPPDVVKTRLQLRNEGGAVSAPASAAASVPAAAPATAPVTSPRKYNNTVHALRRILREEGPRALFDGLGLRVARKALSSAVAWTVYEEVVRRGGLRGFGRGA